MIDRRTALQVVAALLGASPGSRGTQVQGIVNRFLLNPRGGEIIEIDFGAGAYAVNTIRLVQGAITVTIKTADLFAALK